MLALTIEAGESLLKLYFAAIFFRVCKIVRIKKQIFTLIIENSENVSMMIGKNTHCDASYVL